MMDHHTVKVDAELTTNNMSKRAQEVADAFENLADELDESGSARPSWLEDYAEELELRAAATDSQERAMAFEEAAKLARHYYDKNA